MEWLDKNWTDFLQTMALIAIAIYLHYHNKVHKYVQYGPPRPNVRVRPSDESPLVDDRSGPPKGERPMQNGRV